jgi:hypothetical protein
MDGPHSRWRRRRSAYNALLTGLGLLATFLILTGLGYAGTAWALALLGLVSFAFSWRQTQALRHSSGTDLARRAR